MADVARAIDPPLGEREAEVHALLYSGQDYVLCWPLILLAEKLEFWEARSVI
ncbi:MAG: hypothetical protein KF688_16565 [Pirellulales bacterium]|nr:hypothetical protein [Pirellulales bacterium]